MEVSRLCAFLQVNSRLGCGTIEGIKRLAERIRAILASRSFFWITIAFFVFESAWIALSAVYPQAFDEQFHFGIIQVYSHHWSPFLRSQPRSADAYGAVTHDPSFLYHYLMSFPYRVIRYFTHDQTIQIIVLRFIDIGLFTSGLLLFRKMLRRTGMPDVAVNTSIFITALTPAAPLLASQINYDNLLIPLTAWSLLLTFTVIDQLQKHRPNIQSILGLVTVGLLSSMVKYDFGPIFLALLLFIGVLFWKRLNGQLPSWWRHASRDWKKAGARKWLIAVLLLAALCLFIGRDMGNLITYHALMPDCSKVLSASDCNAYSVWSHDSAAHNDVVRHVVFVNHNPIVYVYEWVYWLWYRLFFAVNGPDSSFQNYPPLPLPAAAFMAIVIFSVVALVVRGRKTFAGRPYIQLLAIVVLMYLGALLGDGYVKYLDTGVLELMNGRYLLPVLLPGTAVALVAVRELTRSWSNSLRYGVALVVLICFLDGGGLFTFISRSDHGWYWKNEAVERINDDAQKALEPVLFDGSKYYTSSRWFFN